MILDTISWIMDVRVLAYALCLLPYALASTVNLCLAK